MKKIVFSLVMIILGFKQSYAVNDYMCGTSPCYSEGSCDQETGYCRDCADNGYGHNEDGVCVKCQDPNCNDDCEDDYTYCKRCKDGYVSINGKCEERIDSSNCSENCGTCVSGGKCAYCNSGYYVEDGVCKQNPENCSWYNTTTGKCTNCKDGYYLENGNCKQNPEGCSWYNTTTGKCTNCKDGWLSYNGKCEKILENCTDGCKSCSDNIQCYRCKSGYYRADNGTCIKNDVPNCKNISDNGLCSSCETGYLLSDGKCVTLEECITKGYKKISNNYCVPQNCYSAMGNHGTCADCKSGLALQYNKCVPDTCEEGYHLTGSEVYYGPYKQYFWNHKRCVADNCDYFLDSEISCTSCKEGYYLQDRECVSECKEGYIAGTKEGRKTCFPVELGCGYGEKQVGDKCVAREDGEGCGVGFYLKDHLCVSETKGCGDGYLGKDGVCISSADGCGAGYRQFENFCNRIQYTPAEAAALLKDDDNFVILTFKK